MSTEPSITDYLAPKGFRFAAAPAGFRNKDRDDTGLIVSDVPAVAAGTFTLNSFPAAPVIIAKELLQKEPSARAVLINAGCANACTGDEGLNNCRTTLDLVGKALDIAPQSILPASTGVIGTQMDMEKWATVVPELVKRLDDGKPLDFAKAILTTDAFPKIYSATVPLSTGAITLLAIGKGAGMICPHMATMLATVLCDVDVDLKQWQALFKESVEHSFNRVTVDGDTSTNDTVFGLANGASKVSLKEGTDDYAVFQKALTRALRAIAYMLVQDGEGATKVACIRVKGAPTEKDAEKVARTVGHSPLVKTALFGQDANWGRIVMAIGNSGASFDPMDVRVSLCGFELFKDGQPTKAPETCSFDELLEGPLSKQDISIDISLGEGPGEYTLLASDFGHDYITCNASYRS